MAEMTEKYDLILQNSVTNAVYLYSGLTDTSTTHLYHEFEVEIDAPAGEYTYIVLKNTRDDVEYEFKTPIADSIVRADDQEVILRDLQPSTGLMRIGNEIKVVNTYDYNDKNTIYYYDN